MSNVTLQILLLFILFWFPWTGPHNLFVSSASSVPEADQFPEEGLRCGRSWFGSRNR